MWFKSFKKKEVKPFLNIEGKPMCRDCIHFRYNKLFSRRKYWLFGPYIHSRDSYRFAQCVRFGYNEYTYVATFVDHLCGPTRRYFKQREKINE